MVRQRRRKRGLPIGPANKVLPFPPGQIQEVLAVDASVITEFDHAATSKDLNTAHARLAERRLAEALAALEQATLVCAPPSKLTRLEAIYEQALRTYERLHGSTDPEFDPTDDLL